MRRQLIHKALFERNVLATLLPAIAGAVNASGFFAVGTYTSHMTGLVSRAGDELAQLHLWIFARAMLFVACFILGAMAATVLVLQARRRNQPAFWRPLLLESAVLLCFASVNVGSTGRAHLGSLAMTSLICFGMGVQNALVTKMSGATIRTTHLTGVSTDIGIELMRLVYRWNGLRRCGDGEHLQRFGLISAEADLRKLGLHLRIFLSFFTGAVLGPALYLVVGHSAMLIPVSLLLGLAIFDLKLGLGSGA